jgi:arylsulfatase A-like enzyme
MQAIVDGRWHYVRHDVFDAELYDLETDFDESENLAGRPGHAAVVDSLDQRIDRLWEAGPGR